MRKMIIYNLLFISGGTARVGKRSLSVSTSAEPVSPDPICDYIRSISAGGEYRAPVTGGEAG
jgi:hypothetical protein